MRQLLILLSLLLLAGCANRNSCGNFTVRLAVDHAPDAPGYDKIALDHRPSQPEPLWLQHQATIDGIGLKSALIAKGAPLFTAQQLAQMKHNPRMKQLTAETERAYVGGQPEVRIFFKEDARGRLAELTKRNPGAKIAVTLDDTLFLAAIAEPSTAGEAKVSGIATEEEAAKMVSRINELSACTP